jgi:hypothetical protein
VSVSDAADEVAYRFEVPSVVLDAQGHLLPLTNPNVQGLLAARRSWPYASPGRRRINRNQDSGDA